MSKKILANNLNCRSDTKSNKLNFLPALRGDTYSIAVGYKKVFDFN